MNRKKYSETFRREAVRKLELRGERTAEEISRELGIAPSQLYAWRKKYKDTVAEARAERGESLEEEVKRLRGEVKHLKRQQEILKKATAFFAKESER